VHVPETEQHEVAALGEVAMLVEDAVVGQEVLPVHGPHLAVRADGARVREVALEPRCPDERNEAFRRARDVGERVACRADESRSQEEVLRRVAGYGELREDDEVGLGGARVGEEGDDLLAIAVEVPDDGVQLCERQSQGFRLTVTNRV